MKKILLFALVVIFLSCNNRSKKAAANTSNSKRPLKNNLLKAYKPYFDGIWVATDYISDLAKTKSPYKSRNKFGGIASLEINIDPNKADSTVAGVSLNNHEGTNLTIYLKIGLRKNSLKINWKDYDISTNFYELGYSIIHKDTGLVLYHYNKNNQLIDSTLYLKALQTAPDNDMGYGIQYVTNKILITGTYKLIDSAGTPLKIEFTNRGDVSGFLNFKTYYVNTDFEAGPENNIDEITFDLYTKHQKDYAYKLNADTLYLYETNANKDSTKLFFGKMLYKIVRDK